MSALMDNNERGHTLMELVVVLLIFSICLAIPTLSFVSQGEGREVEAFVSEFEQDMYYAQQQAMGKNIIAQINVQNSQRSYQVVVDEEIIKRVPFPEDVSFQWVSIDFGNIPTGTLIFLTNGNTSTAGQFDIRSNRETYRVTLLVGSGRFYIE
ncbi:competence type IV pilus minor pilin ComGD [Natribacillus halophilus]|uniref:Competence protein ComGD n=1 Tax=Natribacillus halophilus TaxID=549003 RepID=A0A1G8JN03_9BACI|nr:competence type IV pilus minor pilin ComGD [Natribacillus halophilus]SDI32397.1 competence protein ComGD [Natribacillus halophilus]